MDTHSGPGKTGSRKVDDPLEIPMLVETERGFRSPAFPVIPRIVGDHRKPQGGVDSRHFQQIPAIRPETVHQHDNAFGPPVREKPASRQGVPLMRLDGEVFPLQPPRRRRIEPGIPPPAVLSHGKRVKKPRQNRINDENGEENHHRNNYNSSPQSRHALIIPPGLLCDHFVDTL